MIDRKAILKQLEELVEQAEIMERHNETLGYDDKVKEYAEMGEKYEYLSSLVTDDIESNPDDNGVEYDPADGEGHFTTYKGLPEPDENGIIRFEVKNGWEEYKP